MRRPVHEVRCVVPGCGARKEKASIPGCPTCWESAPSLARMDYLRTAASARFAPNPPRAMREARVRFGLAVRGIGL